MRNPARRFRSKRDAPSTQMLLLLLLCLSAAAAGPPPAFPDPATLDPKVAAPRDHIGHEAGERAVRYEPLMRYLRALDGSCDAVTLSTYARSHEGRDLCYLTVTSPANHARLEAIRTAAARLADPRGTTPEAAQRAIETLPGIAWLAYSIHGDELSSTDAAVQVAYQLAAGRDDATRRLREELVIHIDPLQNPDGRERYLAQLEALTGAVPNADVQAMQHTGLWSAGRGNHYLSDLNRDWLAQVHPETRGRAAAIRLWNPHLLVDSHEMWPLDTYLFDPPREPFNVALSESNLAWRRRFSADMASAFDRHGWSYYTKEWYEEWYPGYTNAWANLLGAVGILYEQAAVNGAEVRQESGRTLTYREAVTHHVTSSLANLETLRVNRVGVLRDFAADRRWAVSPEGPLDQVFLAAPGRDPALLRRFTAVLDRQSIEHSTAPGELRARGVVDAWGVRSESMSLPAGTIVVRPAQPHRRLLHALLGFDPHMSPSFLEEERREIEKRRESRIYDVTAWSLPLALGLEAYWADGVSEADAGVDAGADAAGAQGPPAAAAPERANAPGTEPTYGYLLDGASSDVARAAADLLQRGYIARAATRPFTCGGRRYLPGTLLLRRHENPTGLDEAVRRLESLQVDLRPAPTALSEDGPDLGGQRFGLLQPPRVAIASQWPIATTSFGFMWQLLDERLGLRSSPINVQDLSRIDLRKYNVLIIPAAGTGSTLSAVLNEEALRRIRSWVESGGTLIACGESAAFLADPKPGLSAVRRRRDVLAELAVYEEAARREEAARKASVDPDLVWGRGGSAGEGTAAGTAAEPEKPDGPGATAQGGAAPSTGAAAIDAEALKRTDEWERLFSPQGAIVAARLDPEHFLCFGLGERVPVLVTGNVAFMSRDPVVTPARLEEEAKLRLSGLLWPEARRRLARSAYATVERLGAGQVILFASDPFFRGYFEGSGRMLANAVLLGPGLGTSPPVPW